MDSPERDRRALCLGYLCDQQPSAGLLVLTGLCDVQARPRSGEIDAKEMIGWAGLGGERACEETVLREPVTRVISGKTSLLATFSVGVGGQDLGGN